MNIDELKKAWTEEEAFEDTPEINTENRGRVQLPLEKMRKNMRLEFWSTAGIFIFAFCLITVADGTFKFKFYLTILIASMLLVTSFFFSQFFRLYKNMSDPEMKTYDSLKDLLHQLSLNKQYYLSFFLSFVPFLVCEIIIVLEFVPRPVPLSYTQIASVLIGTVLIVLPLLFVFGKWWFEKMYGKYIRQIEDLLSEFKN
ncbi:hypothetical protein [uncultured Chryseobacterium sp.]|uniref:hypothetical protein n=1 Tax=uncultured Chryseobacterium sp. TaxID=259322 RepID=UPI0025E42D5B|nr:hypothetical protein [uncultured Chryseobacterium sp.]